MTSKGNKFVTSVEYPYSDKWDKTNNYVHFNLDNVHYSLCNGIRRIIHSSVPSVGFRTEPYKKSDVKIEHNDSPLHNEFLSHRIAMIPINYKKVEQYDPDEFLFEIDEINDTNVIKEITTEHIKVKRVSNNKYLSDKDVQKLFPTDPITNDHVVLTILKPKYYTPLKFNSEKISEINNNYDKKVSEVVRLKVTGKATVSSGSENSHFSPVSTACFINRVDPEKAKIAEDEYVSREIEMAKMNDLTPYPEDKLRKKFVVSERGRFFYTNEKGEPDRFLFKVESVGVIPPLVIFHQGVKLLIDKINLFISNLVNRNKSVVTIEPSKQISKGFDIYIIDEDDTLGNIVQSYLSNAYCDYLIPQEERLLNFIGYKKPHPLENYIIISVQANGKGIDEIIENVMVPGCKNIIKILNKINSELENTKQFTDEMKKIANH